MTKPIDVVIVGGGPGGSVCASTLVRNHNLSVIVFEKTQFPRFHLGESLLPGSLPVLDEIGVLPLIKDTFIWKYGARFHDDTNNKKDRFAFENAWKPDHPHAFEVPRDLFDKILLDHARGSGAIVREQWTVKKITTDPTTGRANGVDVMSPEGTLEHVDARFVVDASGRDAITAHAGSSSTTAKIPGLDQTAFFGHFENVPRQAGNLAGDIDIVLFGGNIHPNWFWFIPFKDGRTSVGAVVSKAWLQDARAKLEPQGGKLDPSAFFDAAVAASTTATELLANAKSLWETKQATADFSYRVAKMRGNGVIRVGDAGGFIDPLFSTGAHIAMTGGKYGADAIARALKSPAEEAAILEEWEGRMRTAAETFILAVQSFYAGPLVGLLFAEDKHAVLRRSITSLLAGDVFGDSVWLRDTRTRLKEMLAEARGAVAAQQSTL